MLICLPPSTFPPSPVVTEGGSDQRRRSPDDGEQAAAPAGGRFYAEQKKGEVNLLLNSRGVERQPDRRWIMDGMLEFDRCCRSGLGRKRFREGSEGPV